MKNEMPYKTLALYTVPVENKPGRLAAITDAISKAGISLTGLASFPQGDSAFVRFSSDEPEGKVFEALEEVGLQSYKTGGAAVTLGNRPGALNEILQDILGEGLNINGIFGTTTGTGSTVVITVDPSRTGSKSLDETLQKHFGSVAVAA